MARLPTRPARGIVNHVNDPDPRDAAAACGEAVKYKPSTCGRAWRTYGLYGEVKQKIERAKEKGTSIQGSSALKSERVREC